MKRKIINNLYKLWEEIGASKEVLPKKEGYSFVYSKDASWPSKVFRIQKREIDLKELADKITTAQLPNSVSLLENREVEEQLVAHNFEFKSTVKAMYLDIEEEHVHIASFKSIERVSNKLKAMEFAKIATAAFGYSVFASTIMSLIDSTSVELFIGKHNKEYVSCGLVLHEENGVSGIHMIGTLEACRGLGIGKIMTNRLLQAAYEKKSTQIVLVTSTAGERIYTKLGFKTEGNLNSYSLGV